ncbi:MAG: alpha/beta fold hydrolase, partial [Pseudomonadota bacterium]
ESLAPWLKRLVADPEMISWNYVQAAATTRKDAALREGQQSLAEALFPDGVQSFDVAAQLRRVSCPARIIFGKKDRIIPWRHALEAPGCVGLHLFDGLGHMPHLEDPGAVARLLRAAHS